MPKEMDQKIRLNVLFCVDTKEWPETSAIPNLRHVLATASPVVPFVARLRDTSPTDLYTNMNQYDLVVLLPQKEISEGPLGGWYVKLNRPLARIGQAARDSGIPFYVGTIYTVNELFTTNSPLKSFEKVYLGKTIHYLPSVIDSIAETYPTVNSVKLSNIGETLLLISNL